MQVVLARALGMCFGVRDAISAIEQLTQPHETTIYGELVHNQLVTSSLARRGFHMLAENDRVHGVQTDNVVITAHGISDTERARLQNQGKALIDTTCPLVRRVHELAQQLERDGWFIVLIGKHGHVEVLGLTGDLGHVEVVADPQQVRHYPANRIAVLCQTTTRPADAENICDAIRAANSGATVRFFDTICKPTRDRQLAAEELVQAVDAVVVVGGRHSNNTLQLVALAQQHGLPVLHVQCAAELSPDWFTPFHVVGLTAGTSTMQETIDEVYAVLQSLPAPVHV
jgi:4-hydroxy-3-methylbut-2-enyl diphosphate reductase